MIYKRNHGNISDKLKMECMEANLVTLEKEINSNMAEIVSLLPDDIQAYMIEKNTNILLKMIGV